MTPNQRPPDAEQVRTALVVLMRAPLDVLDAELERISFNFDYTRALRNLIIAEIDRRAREAHEPPRNSGEGDAVNGPTPLVGESNAGE